MQLKPITIFIMISVILFSSFCCRDHENIHETPLKKECEIYEESIGRIQNKFNELKEAELTNRLQTQLDLRREIDALIIGLNNDLKEYSQKQNFEKNIPFVQANNKEALDVVEVKLLGCGFNEEIMDLQVRLAAVARVKENTNNFLKADLLDSSGKPQKEIYFNLANDYPEKGKTVLLLSHIEGAELLKYFASIRFVGSQQK